MPGATATHLFTQLLVFTVNILQQHGKTMLELQLKFHAYKISPSFCYGNCFLRFEFRPNFKIHLFRKFQNTQKKFKEKTQVLG